MPTLDDFELRTMPGLWRWYEQSARQLTFHAQTREQAESWQTTLRETLMRLLGRLPEKPATPDVQLIETVETPEFTRQLIVVQTAPGEYMPCYVLLPHAPRPASKTIIALHGHGTWGAKGIVGIADSPVEAEFIRQLNYDYARQFAARGHLVFAPVLRGFAERMEPRPTVEAGSPDGPMWLSSCREVALNAILCGTTLLGLRVWDVMRLVDYVATRPDVNMETLACAGLSGGGTVTLFATALDLRIRRAIVSGYLNTFRTSIMSIDHCSCNYIPGLVQVAEMPDLAGLIAPRPLLVESGLHDPIYPVEGTRQALDELRTVYRCFGAEDRLESDIFEGEHRWSGQKAYDWMAK